MASSQNLPREVNEALPIIRRVLGRSVVAVYLFGSAVEGGLRPHSDVDILVLLDRGLSEETRRKLIGALMPVSGPVGNDEGRRALELTVVCVADVVPWRYPPQSLLVYGEWLRGEFESGWIPAPRADPDLAIVLTQVRATGIPLAGPHARLVLEPVPMADIRRAMRDALPGLIRGLQGDERNVLLTLARMWLTAAEGEILPKDVAAEWAIARFPGGKASLLDLARRGYLGLCEDSWTGKEAALEALVATMRQAIESCLAVQS